jgi:hypothetical protein
MQDTARGCFDTPPRFRAATANRRARLPDSWRRSTSPTRPAQPRPDRDSPVTTIAAPSSRRAPESARRRRKRRCAPPGFCPVHRQTGDDKPMVKHVSPTAILRDGRSKADPINNLAPMFFALSSRPPAAMTHTVNCIGSGFSGLPLFHLKIFRGSQGQGQPAAAREPRINAVSETTLQIRSKLAGHVSPAIAGSGENA